MSDLTEEQRLLEIANNIRTVENTKAPYDPIVDLSGRISQIEGGLGEIVQAVNGHSDQMGRSMYAADVAGQERQRLSQAMTDVAARIEGAVQAIHQLDAAIVAVDKRLQDLEGARHDAYVEHDEGDAPRKIDFPQS